jgi:hypothetical protein
MQSYSPPAKSSNEKEIAYVSKRKIKTTFKLDFKRRGTLPEQSDGAGLSKQPYPDL